MALLLARELVLRGWAVSIACLRKSSELARHVPVGVRLFMPESPGHLASLRFLGRLRTIVRQSSVVIGTLELQSLFVAALLAPGRSIGWLHKDLFCAPVQGPDDVCCQAQPMHCLCERWHSRLFEGALARVRAALCAHLQSIGHRRDREAFPERDAARRGELRNTKRWFSQWGGSKNRRILSCCLRPLPS